MEEKLTMQTKDLTEENVEKIAQLFPSCVTEAVSEDGSIKRLIDFEALKRQLSGDIIPEGKERYVFTWPGKSEAQRLTNTPTTLTLRPCREKSVNFDNTKNIYIEGDNLDALKLLRETYLGKVKMIYIDPPYNTGNDFVYNDSFSVNELEYSSISGDYDQDLRKLTINSSSSGKYHTQWLNMMYPRLSLAKDLLTDDGVIFISIDDCEFSNLKKICDELFNSVNFVGVIVWQTATDNNPSQISTEHEYILCYAKNRSVVGKWVLPSEKAQLILDQYGKLKSKYLDDVDSIRSELRQWIKTNESRLEGVKHYNYVDSKGVYYPGNSSNTKPGGYNYDIIHPITNGVCAKPEYGYRWPEKTFLEASTRGDVEWGKDETTIPKIKKRLETATEGLKSYYYEDNRYWTKYLNELLGSKVFDNPKSVTLLERLISFTSGSDDIVMDFFSGSASTAHAVLNLNEKKQSDRRFIMVQLPETVSITSEASKHGFNTICDIGEERIRKVCNEISMRSPFVDCGFRTFRIDSSNMNDIYYNPQSIKKDLLDYAADNIKSDRTGEDLFIQVMLELGIELSVPIVKEFIAGKEVISADGNYLIACFDDDVDEVLVTEIAKRKPYYAVFRDSSMSSDAVAINFGEIFKTYSPDTKTKVL